MTLVLILPPRPGDPIEPVTSTHPKRRARIAVRRTLDEAEGVAALLSEHGLDALVETDDLQLAMPGSSVLPGVLGVPGGMFAYPVTVPFAERAQARALVVEREQRAPAIATSTLARGAAIALALACLAAAGRIALS